MLERFPDDSNLIYDLGIVNYLRHDYKSALDLFKQAITMDNNLDAYLYAGITLEILSDIDIPFGCCKFKFIGTCHSVSKGL